MRGSSRWWLVLVALVLVAAGCSSSSSSSSSCDDEDDCADPADAVGEVTDVDIDGVFEHLEALAAIAAEAGGNRAAGTPGYEASADLVVARLRAAGYEVERQRFSFPFFEVASPSSLRVGGDSFGEDRDLKAMLYSAPGEVSAPLEPVGFERDASGRNGPGCDPGAFAGIEPGAIVLLRPGPCLFRDQVVNAQAAGAGAVVFAFPEFAPNEVLRPTLISPDAIEVPVVAATDEVGLALDEHAGQTATLAVDAVVERRTTENVIAESGGGDPDRVIMAGGHLDSVIDGPGINDNGSGISTLIEVAEQMADIQVVNKLRFAFWSAEELGLLGSTHYVESLSEAQRDDIAMYLNFDMLGSPNHVRYVYADSNAAGGSDAITERFRDYFEDRGLPSLELDLEGRSDHGPFLRAGIPIGGLFSGADMIKSARDQELFGGERGAWEDPCYHLACDDLDNVDLDFLDTMADAVGAALAAYATAEGLP